MTEGHTELLTCAHIAKRAHELDKLRYHVSAYKVRLLAQAELIVQYALWCLQVPVALRAPPQSVDTALRLGRHRANITISQDYSRYEIKIRELSPFSSRTTLFRSSAAASRSIQRSPRYRTTCDDEESYRTVRARISCITL
jgi:hypothetical protein